jgi:hypothetical protein
MYSPSKYEALGLASRNNLQFEARNEEPEKPRFGFKKVNSVCTSGRFILTQRETRPRR